MAGIDEILEFWFGVGEEAERDRRVWFVADPAFDQACGTFRSALEWADTGELDQWKNEVRGALALTLLFDQFPRNIFRGAARAFATDHKARAVAGDAVARGFDRTFKPVQRAFFYLPFEHSENIDDQRRSVSLFAALAGEYPAAAGNLRYAQQHFEIIQRFGRFPHRNAVLGRRSTAEEEQFLASPRSQF